MNRKLAGLVSISMLFAALSPSHSDAGEPAHAPGTPQSDGTIAITASESLVWQDYPGLPGVKFAVIAGNPKEAGFYTIRAKFAPGTMSRPHSHPEARYITVLKGTWWAGTGAKFDPNATIPVPAGGFAVHTPGKVHFDGAKDEEVIVQISGIGPSGTIVAEEGK